MSWETSAREIREGITQAIPSKWRLDPALTIGLKDVTSVPSSCGLLSKEDLSITELTATELVEKIATGQLSATRATEAFCARTAIAHQLVNCLTAFFPDQGLKRAAELDEHLKRTGKVVGPLHGVPIALKDTYDVPGYATTWGYAANANHRAQRESATVKTLREAGAVFYAKTTMPQMGMLLETVSNLYGRTLNPFNLDFGPGGSSGGDSALVALKGCPMTPSTDIGGSIRAPAAFTGLYGIRPSADRVPKRGMKSVESGQLNIRVSCGPICHSMSDLKLMTRTLLDWPQRRYDTTCVPVPWREVPQPSKLAFGLWEWDGVVMPHPPILRAMRETADKLRVQGHEVIPFKMPFDCWETAQVYFDIYFQCGIEDSLKAFEKAGETPMPGLTKMFEVFNVGADTKTARDVIKLIQSQTRYREAMCDAWDTTTEKTSTGRPIDGLICPVGPIAGYPHDFLPWWGYTCLFNLLDYPSTVLPVKSIKINAKDDPKDTGYTAQNNPFDGKNHEIYDPDQWSNQPVTIQIVARPFDDEELVYATGVVDKVINSS